MTQVARDEMGRRILGPDRRRFARGGRRVGDADGRHPTVAIIERYEGVRRTCARYLSHFHFDVAEAANADAGLAVLERTRPAVLLVEDGASSHFDQLRHQARDLAIPIVSMTTTARDTPAPQEDETTPAGVLVKPFPLGAMLEEIRRVLRSAQAVGQP